MLAMLFAGFAAAAPFAARAAGGWEHAAAQREQSVQEASWRTVPAVVRSAPEAVRSVPLAEATARWTAPDGAMVMSRIPVPPGTRPGTTVRIWVTRDGTPTSAPLLDSQVSGQTKFAATAAVTALAFTTAAAGAMARGSLDKRRMAGWDAEWRATGPRWTHRA